MSRDDLSEEGAAQVLSDHLRPFVVVDLDYPNGAVRATSLDRIVTIDGQTYYGVGIYGQTSAITEGSEQKSYGVKVTLAGVPGAFANYLNSLDVQNREGKIRIGFVDRNYDIVGPLTTIFVGRMDTQDYSVGQKTTVEVALESLLVDWERPRVRRYTDADQRGLYPSDRGLEYVALMSTAEIVWGRA